jgi:chorismate mutase/prephenate dehydrogenase
VSDQLSIYRSLVDVIDRIVLELLATRMTLSRLIGAVKRGQGLPIVDEDLEVKRITKMLAYAEQLGLPESMVRELYGTIVAWSRCAQVYCPTRVRIAIYGPGSMGTMLARLLGSAGCWVVLTGRSWEKAARAAREARVKAKEWRDAVEWADMVVYAVPSNVVPQLLRQHWSMYRESMLVTDIASVKSMIARAFVELAKRAWEESPDYASLHPLFGPLECSAGETVVIVPLKLSEEWREKLESLLAKGLGYRVVYMSPDEHDKVMAASQVLHHLVLDLFVEASKRLSRQLGFNLDLAWSKAATRSLRASLDIVRRIESLRSVVREIRMLNPYTPHVLEALRSVLEELRVKHSGGER